MTIKFVTNEKVAETSSKGNQEKWLDNGRWYKLDQFGYEGLAETTISALLERSNIEHDTPFTFTRYRMERMNVHGRDRNGCSSKSFLDEGESIITLAHLYTRFESKALKETLTGLSSDKKRIAYLGDVTAEYTGLKEFPQYLALLFEVDALFLNDDRHLNNIAVIEKTDSFLTAQSLITAQACSPIRRCCLWILNQWRSFKRRLQDRSIQHLLVK